MNSQDMMSQDNNRAEAIRKITAFCDLRGYSYNFTEKEFTIHLPAIESLPSPVDMPHRRRTVEITGLDFLRADSNGYNEEEDLPPVDTTLTEGEPPKEEQ